MKTRLLAIAKYAAYPAFYLFCLGVFGYFTFPYDRLKDRLIAEFDRMQQKRSASGPPQRLEIDELDAYWFTGVEVKGARLIIPPAEPSSLRSSASFGASGDGAKEAPPKPSVITIDEGHVRVKILPLLLGRVRASFWASVFGGEVSGTVPVGKSSGDVYVEATSVDLAKVEPLTDVLGLPLAGTVNATLELSAPDGKFNKANGALELTAKDVSVGDGKTKIQGLIALPEAKLGELSLSAEAKDGVLKVTKMAANGVDLELAGDGKINVREPWNSSTADLYVRFKFTDAYRAKNDVTKSLLGAPGSTLPGLIEMQQPKMKRAKRTDGFYGFHVHGPLKKPRFDPQATDAPGARAKGKGSESPFPGPGGSVKRPGLNFPLGPSEASGGKPSEEEESAPPSPPPPVAPSPPPPMPDEGRPPADIPQRVPPVRPNMEHEGDPPPPE